MKLWMKWLDHLVAAIGMFTILLAYLDNRNPSMGFLSSNAGRIYLCVAGALILGYVWLQRWRHHAHRNQHNQHKQHKDE